MAVQTLPILLFGPYGGVIADRVDKRRLMMVQAGDGHRTRCLGLLTVTGKVQVWQIIRARGTARREQRVRQPTRQAFVLEMVGPEHLRNAVSLNSVLVNVARAVGPAVAGI